MTGRHINEDGIKIMTSGVVKYNPNGQWGYNQNTVEEIGSEN